MNTVRDFINLLIGCSPDTELIFAYPGAAGKTSITISENLLPNGAWETVLKLVPVFDDGVITNGQTLDRPEAP